MDRTSSRCFLFARFVVIVLTGTLLLAPPTFAAELTAVGISDVQPTRLFSAPRRRLANYLPTTRRVTDLTKRVLSATGLGSARAIAHSEQHTAPSAPDTPERRAIRSDLPKKISRLYRQITALKSFEPAPNVNRVFTELVGLSLIDAHTEDANAVLQHPDVAKLRPHLIQLCAQGESALEAHWAKEIAEAPQPRQQLAQFPYVTNYKALARMELNGLHSLTGRPVRNVLFIGAGPLPLSSLVMAQDHGVRVHNIDIDPTAVAAGRQVIRKLGIPRKKIGYDVGDALRLRLTDRYDAIFVAALVGLSADAKRNVVEHLANEMATTSPDSLLLIRSAHGLRQLLYPVADVEGIPGVRRLLEIHPRNEVVNSFIIADGLNGTARPGN